MYINESYSIAPGALGIFDAAQISAQTQAAQQGAAQATGKKKSKLSSVASFGSNLLENFFRGKLSQEQLAQQAQTFALLQQGQQGAGLQQMMPLLLIGGVAIVGILLITKKKD